MRCQKSHSLRLFLWKNIFVVSVGFLTSFLGISFNSNEVLALFVPTLSASIDNTAASVNGNQVINSANKTTEIPLNLTVNTNNRTGYNATLSSETDETALVNNDSTNGAKINSISSAGLLGDFSSNTWGVKVGNNTNFSPIPKLTSPMNAIQTTGKTNGNEVNSIKIGMKLGDNLESGSYSNKLIFSILTNNYDHIALMTEGPDFNTKLKSLETATNKIEYFKKSAVAPAASVNAVNIEDEDSDYEIKLWLDPSDKTAYYYAEPEKVHLNKDARSMFSGMSNLTTLNISNFDTSQVTDMSYMFMHMSSLTTLDLSNFNTSKVTNMGNMFYGMRNLTTFNLSSFDTSKVTNMASMFSGMSNLTTLDLSNFDTSQVTNMVSMFSNMSSLTTINLSNFDTSKVTDMSAMFYNMSNLTTLNLSNFDTSQVIYMESMFYGVRNLTTLNLSNFDTSKVTNMRTMFYDMRNLTTLNISSFDTSQVTDMNNMFAYMSNLTTLDLSSFNTSKVTDMRYMFVFMVSLTALNLSNFDTSHVTNMGSMFYGTTSLPTLDISSFDTSHVTDMNNMFSLPNEEMPNDKLEKIYVNNDFNTTNLTNFSQMFRNRMKLRGGNGSYLANPTTADKTWLRVDRPGVQGYFTRKP